MRLPKLPLDAALADTSSLDGLLHRHGYVVLGGCPATLLEMLRAVDAQAAALPSLAATHRNSAAGVSTRSRTACRHLPLTGLGMHAVRDGDRLVRHQFHLLTDAAALQLVAWPHRRPELRRAAEACARELHALSCALLRKLVGGVRLEQQRQEQAAARGDPSVLDLFC